MNIRRYSSDKLLIDQFLDMMLSEKNSSLSTRKAYLGDLKELSDFFLKLNTNFIKCKDNDLVQWINSLADKNLSKKTRSRKLSALRQFMHFMIVDNYRTDDPSLAL